tara:strand:- start:137 stop:424 length:288 start_codon:yes stop_codon:yes gene_type:complete
MHLYSVEETEEETEELRTKEEFVVEFIKAFDANEKAMEPFKEFRRDLRKNYVENEWLTREELRHAVKAYRMLSKDEDFDQFHIIYEKIAKSLGKS